MAAPSELFCWRGGWALPSVHADSLVVLAYARFTGAPLNIHMLSNPWRSPTGSLPALKTRDEGAFSQPSKIITHLRKQKYNADYDLSAKEGADTLAFISLLEEKLIPAQIYALWIDPKNYVEVTRRWYAENIPFPLNFVLPGRMQHKQLERLRLMRGDGALEAGEEVEKELYRDARECMNLLSQRLGSNRFFFGDSPISLDTSTHRVLLGPYMLTTAHTLKWAVKHALLSGRLRVWPPGTSTEDQTAQQQTAAAPEGFGQPGQLLLQHPVHLLPQRDSRGGGAGSVQHTGGE
ncbi:metaxin-1a isoform X2 [Brachyhypopomus gauderio]|uniref:metaxin-1a isoform X2 n=1 Tax=Brachyhypopomus gauderio TaxID=698409 RepID=UPI004041E960